MLCALPFVGARDQDPNTIGSFSLFIYQPTYRTCPTISRGYYYFFLKSHVGFSLMFGGIPLKICSYKTRAVINQARLITARVR